METETSHLYLQENKVVRTLLQLLDAELGEQLLRVGEIASLHPMALEGSAVIPIRSN